MRNRLVWDALNFVVSDVEGFQVHEVGEGGEGRSVEGVPSQSQVHQTWNLIWRHFDVHDLVAASVYLPKATFNVKMSTAKL